MKLEGVIIFLTGALCGALLAYIEQFHRFSDESYDPPACKTTVLPTLPTALEVDNTPCLPCDTPKEVENTPCLPCDTTKEVPMTSADVIQWKTDMYRSAGFSSDETPNLNPGAGIYPKTIKDATKKFSKPANLIDSRFEVGEHRLFYGGPWSRGFDGFNMLLEAGLEPHHKVLDIGCGSLRAGIHYIRYLEAENYFGFDADELSMRAGVEFEIPMAGLQSKRPHLMLNQNFDIQKFGQKFDFAIAFQVLKVGMPRALKVRCIRQLALSLAPKGRVFLVGPAEAFDSIALENGLRKVQTGSVVSVFQYKSAVHIPYIEYMLPQ